MANPMTHKIELVTILTGVFTSAFFHDLFDKVIMTVVAMLVATTLAHYWKKYLESIDEKKRKKK